MTQNIRSYAYLVTTMLFWSGTFVSCKVVAESIHPVIGALFRFSFATLTLATLLLLQKKKIPIPSQKELFLICILALSGPIGFNLFFFKGLQYIEAGRASLIAALNPLLITLAAALFLGEKLKPQQCFGLVLALVGALYVLSNGDFESVFTGGIGLGDVAIFGAISSWTVYSLVGTRVMKKFTPLHTVFYSSLIGSGLLLILALNYDLSNTVSSMTTNSWVNLFFIGTFGTAGGVTLYYAGMQNIGAVRAGAFINLVPFFAVLLSWLILDEPITLPVLGGGMFLILGVYMTGKVICKRDIVKKSSYDT